MKQSKQIIGVNAFTYPEIRNFAGHEFENYTFRKVYDWYKIPSFLLFKLKKKINRRWQNSFRDLGLNSCSFFHFFNVINEGPQPYITTYETTLPRWRDTPEDFEKGLGIIARDNCIQLLALSDCAYRRQADIIRKYQPHLLEVIMKKNRVLLPPQAAFIKDINEKRRPAEQIVFTMVGADFFRKGGIAVIQAFDELLGSDLPLKLNIVSTLNYGDYASKSTADDLHYVIQTIEKYPGQINWLKQLNNEQVKNLLLDTDVALLPSLAETFGYFILEAQAAGCPVITTDIRAMPEINNDTKGWLIRIKADGKDEADLSDPPKLTEKIKNNLIEVIGKIISNKEVIREKGEKALKDILLYHSPERHRETLLSIYKSVNNK